MGKAPRVRSFGEVTRDQRDRMYALAARLRLVVVPLIMGLATLASFFDPAIWRRWVLGLSFVVLSGFSAFEARRARDKPMSPRTLPLNLLVMGTFAPLAIFATGALESPLAPALLLIGFIVGILFSPRLALAGAGWLVTVVWFFAWGQIGGWFPHVTLSIFGGSVRAGHNDPLLVAWAVILSLLVIAANRLGALLRRAFDRATAEALAARDDLLRSHVERGREMEALAGEIAHELKNPLATLKGLGATLARDPRDPKNAERLRVLRREIDRMHGVLQEFLTLSRPVGDLALRPVDVAGLCEEVLLQHEPLALERGVVLRLKADADATARCDGRKVKQILLNLVQNGLAASPRGSALVVQVEAGEKPDLSVRVLDEGAGLDPAIADRVFEAGVTGGSQGSGLGLTVARSLARQHGGDLTLRNREAGGCVAELVLPREGPPADEVAA